MKKGQALLLVFFIFLVMGIVTGSLVVMWKAEIKSRTLERDSLTAFYIAQAGMEMAKMTLWYYTYYGDLSRWYYWPYSWPGEGNANFGGGSYAVTVFPYGFSWAKTLVSTGTYRNATRQIALILDLNYYGYYYMPWVRAGSWQEQ